MMNPPAPLSLSHSLIFGVIRHFRRAEYAEQTYSTYISGNLTANLSHEDLTVRI